ncbi:MAG: type II toxin-antitoxin system HigB family toxin [Bryobacteraceae bacterium]
MNVISKRGLMERARKHPATAGELAIWYGIARRAEWSRLEDVRADFPSADQVGRVLVFNVRWNAFRLIVTVDYPTKRLFVKALLTHKEYDRKEWMKWTKP